MTAGMRSRSDDRASASGVVRPLRPARDDGQLVEALRSGQGWARAAFFDKYAPLVERIVRRILGNDRHTELADVVHDAFVQALASLDRLRDPQALPAWMETVAVHTAHKTIRARRARRWLRFWEPSEIPERSCEGAPPEMIEACARTYALLEKMPTDERIAFALRHIEGMELGRLAEVCSVSLATIKRRLARAEQRFARAAARDECLRSWVEEGGRWTS